MELWGGHECTVNRVGDRYRDQTVLTGHQDRMEDLELFAALGVRKLRYPVLWERVAPDQPDARDWRWADERVAEIRRLGMQPILGLTHHGSGPRYTSLIDDGFAPGLAAHAAAAARRYPDALDWTPVNEPLTTARFSALYGHWYPHARDECSFWTALLNQIDATRLSMRAIRDVNSAARLVQTEDLGRCYSTEPVAWVADHYNHRRWMSWDLLCGTVVPGHPLWSELVEMGFGDRLRAIADDPCPPQVIGVNHYPTSDRFLDHRLDAYPFDPPATGYHDLTASRVLDPAPDGLAGVLREAWERYRSPLAVTESHLGCTRDEQLRWLHGAWRTCCALQGEGVDLVALTAWALLGNVDWSSLLTQENDHYEPGVFDVSGGTPRPTALATLLPQLTEPDGRMRCGHDAVLATPGWWERDLRLEHAPFRWADRKAPALLPEREPVRPLVITGATGRLGRALAGGCEVRGLRYLLTDRRTLPIDEPERVAAFLDRHRPWALINAAGWSRVDAGEADEAACRRANSDGAAVLAAACADAGVHCTLVSCDQVFDGAKDDLYREDDAPRPLSAYGRSKADAERLAFAAAPGTLVVRTAAFFSPYDGGNVAAALEAALRRGEPFGATDHVVSPTYVPDLVNACLDLVIDGERGLWHLTHEEPMSWFGFAQLLADTLGLDRRLVVSASAAEIGWRAPRPPRAPLASARGRLLPTLGDALARHARVRAGAR